MSAAALGSPVRDASGVLIAQAWSDSKSQWWATGYEGRDFVTVPTTGPHPSRDIALLAVGVMVDANGTGRREVASC